jgi:cation-transporting ATPase I
MLDGVLRSARSYLGGLVPGPRRHVWQTAGRAHIEVRGAHRPGRDDFVEAVERALRELEGVDWAELNAAVAHVVVAFDGDAVDVGSLVDAVESVEDAYEVGADVLHDAPEHPSAHDAVRLGAVEIGADLAGIAVGFVARAVRLPLLPIEVAAAVPTIDSLPPVRQVLERHRGVEAAVVSTNALLQGLAQGPTGLVVDAAHRVMLLREAVALCRLWEQAEPRLHPGPGSARVGAIMREPRPAPLPDGLLETYARRVALGSLGVGGAVLVATGNPRKAADMILSAVPRAARLGREAFSAQTACVLSARDVVVMDRRPLRRLARVDTVVVDAALLATASTGTSALIAAIRETAQDFVLATGDEAVPPDLAADLTVAGGSRLVQSVRDLQREGRVVAVVSGVSGEALAAADCGIGVGYEGAAPWGAHLLCPTLFDAALVVDATAAARAADRRVVEVAGAGSLLAGAFALGPAPGAAQRMVLTMNVASLAAIAAGAWAGAQLSGRRIVIDDADPVAWHTMSASAVMAQLGTSSAGLGADEVEARHQDFTPGRAPSLAELVVAELSNPLTVLLGVGGAVSTAVGSMSDGLLITGVLGVNALVGAVQRLQAERAIEQLTTSISAGIVSVRRDDTPVRVPPDQVVNGDVLVLEAGDVVPADARVVSATAVEADESSLTGESLPVPKAAGEVSMDAAVADRRSMVYAGTAIAAGRVEAAVVATGGDTEARRGAAEGERAPRSGVETRLDELMRKTVPIVLGAGGVLVGSTLLRGASVREAVSTGVSLAAAAVPEGLPFLATVAQSAAANRLSRRGVLVRNPNVLEALGRADVLCFDKTGTLTEGRLQVRSVSDGEITEGMPDIDGRRRLVLAAALRATPRRRRQQLAHPTDQAVVDAAEVTSVAAELGAPGWRKTASLPFSSARGYHAVLGETPEGTLLSAKGAPEVILPRCDAWRRGEHVVTLDEPTRRHLERLAGQYAAEGLRVLAIAERPASGRNDFDDAHVTRLAFLGLVAVADVTRSSAAEPIAMLQRAGIAVVMLTGDHPHTAATIGSELGLIDGEVMTGAQLDGLDDDELVEVVQRATVFARVTPAHKVRIVKAYQRLGRVVAMTGDGANDAHAIRLADVGVAFGPRATPAARAAADLVIVDDRVETLIASIIEGRAMWASVGDALALLLGGNLGEVIFTTGATLVSGRSPLNARQLLAVNLLTDLAPALAIALQRPPTGRIDLRDVGPEDSLGGQLTREIAVRAAATAGGAAAAWTVARLTGTSTRAGTVALAALVGAQLGQTLVVGYRSPLVVASGLVSTGALVAIIQTPGVSHFFGCRPIGPVGWAIAGGAAGIASVGALAVGRLLGDGTMDDAANGPASLPRGESTPHAETTSSAEVHP